MPEDRWAREAGQGALKKPEALPWVIHTLPDRKGNSTWEELPQDPEGR